MVQIGSPNEFPKNSFIPLVSASAKDNIAYAELLPSSSYSDNH